MMNDAIEVLGWTLLHFVWQGAVVGVLAAVLLVALRRRSANARYLTAVGALGLMLLLPLGTIAWIEQTPPVGDVSPIFNTVSMIEIPRTREDGTLALDEPPIKVERIGIDFENPPPADSVPLIPVSDTGQAILEGLAEQRSALRVESILRPFIPWAVAAWLIGVGVLSLRLLASWLSVQRLRWRSTQPASEHWQAMLRRIADRLRVTRPVKLVESALVEVPTVIGWLSPMILLPASAMTGLTAEQLEALLAHELAHVRRHDYLINLLQAVVETLLFYHPAVWWLSHRIRVEREHCCDDLAASVRGDRLSYAKALVAMESLRAPVSRFALGATGGVLHDRVQRLIGLQPVQQPNVSSQFAVISCSLAIMLVTIFLTQSPRGQGSSPLKPAPTVSDRVLITGVVTDGRDQLVADAEVFLPFDLSNGIPDDEHCEVTRTDENGRYRFEVSSREYFDNAIKGYSFLVWGLRPGTGMGISVIERPKNMMREVISNIQLQAGRPFTLTLVDPDGHPVPDAVIRPSGMDTPTNQFPVPTQFAKRMAVRTDSEGRAEFTEISPMIWFTLQAETTQFGTQALYFFCPQGLRLEDLVYRLKRIARIRGTMSDVPRPTRGNAGGYLITRWNDMKEQFAPGERQLMVGSPHYRVDRLLKSDRSFDLLVPEGLYSFEFHPDFQVQAGTTTTLQIDGDKVEIEMRPTSEPIGPTPRVEQDNGVRPSASKPTDKPADLLSPADKNPKPGDLRSSDATGPEDPRQAQSERVIALVNGVAIHEADVTARYFERLVRGQEQWTPEEFRKMVDDLVRRDLPRIIERKLLVAEAMKLFDPQQRQQADETLQQKFFEEQVVAMMKGSGVTNRDELQNRLRQHGTSLERMEAEFKERFYAQQFLAKKLEGAKTPEETEKLTNELLLQLWQQAEVKSEYLPRRGEINWVDRPNERVWINLGEADGVKRGSVFRVVSIPPNNDPALPVVIKGKIAVIRFLDAHTSEARILESENDGPTKGNEVIPADFPDPKANGIDLRLLFPFRKPNAAQGQFVGRVRLKTEQPLPDLEKVQVPAGKVLDESLVFSKDGGLANVFVYLQKPTFKVAPPTESELVKPFVLIAETGKFWPHAAIVRVGRPAVFENSLLESINFHTHPLRNAQLNYLVTKQDRRKVPPFKSDEPFPLAVKSDVHPWMLAHLLPLEHPFAAITDDDGRFAIEGLPPGEHEFRVWHERVGWLEKSLKLTIKPGEDAKSELEYAPDRLKLTEAEVLGWGNRLIDATRLPRAIVPRPAASKKDDDAKAAPLKSEISNPQPNSTKGAIERGIAFLKAQQQESGAWQGTPADGVTALCAAALLQAGVKADDPVMKQALAHLRKGEPTFSYTVALQTMVFCSASPKEDAELIRRNIAWLENAQATEGPNRGAWSYMANNTKFGDGSCSRFAMLGLHAAKKAGFEVKADTWRNASDYWLTHQKKENHAWSYQPGSGATPSMTLAGMACLAIVNQHLPQDEQTKLRTEAIERAIPFVEPNAHLLWQNGHGGYALQCLERAAHLNRWQKFGKHELRKLIDEKLIGLQRPEGHWTGVGGSGGGFFAPPAEQTPEQKAAAEAARRRQVQSDDLIATSFALMCLTGQPEPPRERQLRFEPREMGKKFQIRTQLDQNSVPPMQRTEISGGFRIVAIEPDGSTWRLEADRAVIESRTGEVNGMSLVGSAGELIRLECNGSVKCDGGGVELATERLSLDLTQKKIRVELQLEDKGRNESSK